MYNTSNLLNSFELSPVNIVFYQFLKWDQFQRKFTTQNVNTTKVPIWNLTLTSWVSLPLHKIIIIIKKNEII